MAATKTYGTGRMDAYSIFENTLNLSTVTIKDRIDDGDGKYHYIVNKNESMLVREKHQIKEAFKEWIFKDPERREKYVEYYNETFNNSVAAVKKSSRFNFPFKFLILSFFLLHCMFFSCYVTYFIKPYITQSTHLAVRINWKTR